MRWNTIRKLVQHNFTKIQNENHLNEIPKWLHQQHLTYDQPSLVGLYFGSICNSNHINDALHVCKDEDKHEFKLTDHDINSLHHLLQNWLNNKFIPTTKHHTPSFSPP